MNQIPARFWPALILPLVLFLSATICRADLETDIHTVLQDRFLQKASVGIEIVRLGQSPETAKPIFALNAHAPLAPASNMKLLTSSVALDRLGPDFKFRTLLVKRGDDLVLLGDGDPSMGDAEMLKKVGWDITTVFQSWVEQLKKRNLTSFHDLLVDDSVFDEMFAHPHWDEKQAHKRYAAQVGGLNLNANAIDFYLKASTVGVPVQFTTNPPTSYISVQNKCLSDHENAVWLSRVAGKNDVVLAGKSPGNTDPVSVTVHDPSMFAGTVLAETLAGAGIRMTGHVVRDRTLRPLIVREIPDPAFQVIAIHETPLSAVLTRMNKDSMNMYAEALCKRVGFTVSAKAGSWENGLAASADLLKRIGVDEKEFHLDDGCGLSRENTLSSDALVHLLIYDYHARHSQMLLTSLPISGQDGTLEKRFEGSDLRGRVLAKTGFINTVSALSGFLKAKDESWYAFSILINNAPAESNWKMKTLQEQILKSLDASTRVSTTRTH